MKEKGGCPMTFTEKSTLCAENDQEFLSEEQYLLDQMEFWLKDYENALAESFASLAKYREFSIRLVNFYKEASHVG
jgi:hypothetical protein